MNVLPSELQEASSLLEHMCRLDYTHEPQYRRMSSIICTIGPSSRNAETIYQMIKAGMNIARINFSHEYHDEHGLSVDCIHQAAARYSKELGYNCHIALAGDLKGREIRTGLLTNRKPIEIKRGDIMKLTINPDLSNKCTKEVVYIDHPGIIKDLEAGQHIFIDDSAIEVEVKEVGVDCLMCQIVNGGLLGNKVSVVAPGVLLSLPILSEKDIHDVKFCVDNNFDYIFLSKMRTGDEVKEVRRLLGGRGKHVKIITKLESAIGLANLEGIMAESDGVLIARADMAIEMSVGRIFLAQKAITARCNRLGKPVICGTQLLMSMTNCSVPMRTDICDIGNALLDGADSMLLSSETAIGQYPVETVRALAFACQEAEAAIWHRKLYDDLITHNPAAVDGAHAIAISAVTTSINVLATAIIVVTVSGKSSHLVSTYRPRCPIFAVTRCSRVARQANIYRGLIPVLISGERQGDYLQDVEERISYALTIGNLMGIVKTGDAVVVLSPWKNSTGFTNNVHVVYAYFERDPVECMAEKQSKVVDKAPARRFLGV